MAMVTKLMYAAWCVVVLAAGSAYAQDPVIVTGKPFVIHSTTRAYDHLNVKLPRLVTTGVLYHSALDFDPLGITKASDFKRITSRSLEKDSAYQALKPLLASFKIRFVLEGEMHVINDQFYITVHATDFKKPLTQYQSSIKPISQLLSVIDEASENINYQIQARLSGQYAVRVQISPFRFDASKKVLASTKDLYAADFPARFIAYNLHSSKVYSVLPYEYNSDTRTKNNAEPSQGKPDVIVSGEVRFDGKGNCTVLPVLYWKGDSLHIFEARGSVRRKDELLERVLANIQTMLDATAGAGSFAEFRRTIANATEGDNKQSFERALTNKNPALASYYAEQLTGTPRGRRLANLYRARLYYAINDYTTALKYAQDHIKDDSASEAGYYYAALCNIRLSKFETAKANLKKVRDNSPDFQDVLFQRGVCLYSQDSIQSALRNFNAQKMKNEGASPELYAYIGFCYEWLAMWKEAERSFLKQWQTDSANISNRGYLINFYNKYGLRLAKAKDYNNAYAYFMKSYSKSKQYGSLFGAVESSLKSRKPDNAIDRLIDMGLKDSVFQGRIIYLELASICRSEVDTANNFVPFFLKKAVRFLKKHIAVSGTNGAYSTLGSTYFRLNMLDSAEYFYTLAKTKSTTDPMHYFNLAELQTMRLKPADALHTLEDANKQFIQDARYPYNDKDYLRALYYFYSMENKAIQGVDFSIDEKGLSALNDNDGKLLFSNWSFRTFFKWASNPGNVSADIKTKLLDNLCAVVQYSQDRDLPCLANANATFMIQRGNRNRSPDDDNEN